MSACKSCGASIIWARTPAGRVIPVDREPTEDGNVRLTYRDHKAHALVVGKGEDLFSSGEARHTSHFATCPDADKHRKPKDRN